MQERPEAYLEPNRSSTVELFPNITAESLIIDIIPGSEPLTIFAKKSSLVVFRLVSEYDSESYL